MENYAEALGEKGEAKAKSLVQQLKAMLDAKGVDVSEFVEYCCGEMGDEGPEMEMEVEGPEMEAEGMDESKDAKKMAIIMALKKKMG